MSIPRTILNPVNSAHHQAVELNYLYNIDWLVLSMIKKILHELEKYYTSRKQVQYCSSKCNICVYHTK